MSDISALNASQKEKLNQFISVAGERVSPQLALKYLVRAKWNSEVAMNNFWEFPPAEHELLPIVDNTTALKTFFQYADDEEVIEEKIQNFLDDLGITGDDVISLVIPWKFNAKVLGVFTKDEFVKGMASLGVGTISELKSKIPSLRSQIDSFENFKAFYNYCFDYALSGESNSLKKVLDLEFAVSLWRIILGTKVPYLEDWITFLEGNKRKAINRDTWILFLEFQRQMKNDFSNYDPNGAWPSTIDEFVEHYRQTHPSTANE